MESVNSRTQRNFTVEPALFGMWVAIGSIVMMFAAFTSAYVVRQAQGNWLEFRLPEWFFLSTVIILLSSLCIHLSYKEFLKGNTANYRNLYILTFVLGLGFVITQYLGWNAMHLSGVELTGNPAGSFVYVISGVHVLHVLGGMAALMVGLLKAFILPHRVTAKRVTRFRMMAHYWHFVDVLWIYLLLFFMFQ
ncbi:MAG: cytochrome oxidase subunit III [Saprospirales bacterium]|nr:MAG: cytochrome oxidase subunit III [Saprospirales bacterium]